MLESFIAIAAVLVDASVKSVVILILAIVGIGIFKLAGKDKLSVHAEHRIWTFVMLSLLALPMIATTTPGWELPVAVLTGRSDVHPVSELDQGARWNNSEIREEETNSKIQQGQTGSVTTKDPARFELINSDIVVPDEPQHHRSTYPDNVLTQFSPESSGISIPLETSTSVPVKSNFGKLMTIVGMGIWLLGSFVLMTRFLIALNWSRRIHGCSKAISLSPEQLAGLPARTAVYENEQVTSPVVSGLLSFQVILPITWRSWSPEKTDAVLAHECAHVRRRDSLICFLSEVVTIVYWFNPISWIAKSRLSQLAELACDQSAALTTGDRLDYAQQLLEIAELNQRQNGFQPGIAMASRSEIANRIECLLDSAKPIAKRTSRFFLAALILVGLPCLLVVATAHPIAKKSIAVDDDESSATNDHQWHRVDGDMAFLRFWAEVVMPDGSIAEGATLHAKMKDGLEVNANGNRFEFEAEVKQGFQSGIQLLATSADGKQMGELLIYHYEMLSFAKNGIRVPIGKSRSVTVNVSDEGRPVAGASVFINGMVGLGIPGVTDQNGEFEFRIPEKSKLHDLSAWTNDDRIGGYMFSRKPVRDPNASEHEIELHNCRQQLIRVVDEKGHPVPNFGFELTVANKPDYNFVPLNGKGDLVTDENGEVDFEWFPEWEDLHYRADDFTDESWSRGAPERIENGVLIVQVEQATKLQRHKISGRVKMPADVEGSFLVRLGSFEHPEEWRYDSLFARCDPQGNFTAEVMPGATYCVFLNDAEWVSDYWTGILYDPETKKANSPMITIKKGEPVEVLVTDGADKTPLPNMTVSFSQDHDFTWLENGISEDGSLGRQWRVTTDEQGRAQTQAHTGELEAHIYYPDWKPDASIEVVAGKTTKIEFHRKSPGNRTLTGKILVADGVEAFLPGTVIKLYSLDGETEGEATATADADGRFSTELSATRIGAIAKTIDGKAFGSIITDRPDDGITLKLLPTAEYHGRLVDEDGNPLSGKWVRMIPQLKNPDHSWANRPRFVRTSHALDKIETVTDADGKFVLEGVPFNMPLQLRCENVLEVEDAGNDSRGRLIGDRFLTPGENRRSDVVRLATISEAATKSPAVMSNYVDQKVTDGRLMGANVLVILSGEGDEVNDFVRRHFYNYDENKDLLRYFPLWIDGPKSLSNTDRVEFFKERNWEVPDAGKIVLAALDGEGKEIGKTLIDTTDEAVADKIKVFVANNVPPIVDAQKKYDEALASAKGSGRKVWVRISQTRCAPCFSLARWLHENESVLQRDYVVLKIDDVLDKNGVEVAKKILNGQHYGVPFHQILDAEGKVLIDSVGPLGNIGHPSSFEGLQQLRKMLETTRGNLTPNDIDELVESAGKQD